MRPASLRTGPAVTAVPAALAAVLLCLALVAAACTPSAVTPDPAPSASSALPSGPAPAPSRTPSTPASPEPTAEASARVEPKRTVVTMGTLTDRRPRTASGSGPADLRYTLRGSFGVVARIDCSRCRGDVSLTAPFRNRPWGTTAAPSRVSYLVVVDSQVDPDQSLLLDATGRWSVTVSSWNRLPPRTGKQSGTGSTVLYLADRGNGLIVTYRPRGRDDSFGARVFSASGDSLLFGESEAKRLSERYEVDLPAVIAIQTKGSWTLTPRG